MSTHVQMVPACTVESILNSPIQIYSSIVQGREGRTQVALPSHPIKCS